MRDAMATACMCVQRGGHGGCARSACVVREGRTWELVSAERTGAARGERDVSPVRVARDHAGDHAGVARSAMTEAGRLTSGPGVGFLFYFLFFWATTISPP